MLKNPYFVLLCVFCVRSAVLGAGLADALAIAGLTALVCYQSYLASQQVVPLNERVKEELDTIKATVAGIKMSNMNRR